MSDEPRYDKMHRSLDYRLATELLGYSVGFENKYTDDPPIWTIHTKTRPLGATDAYRRELTDDLGTSYLYPLPPYSSAYYCIKAVLEYLKVTWAVGRDPMRHAETVFIAQIQVYVPPSDDSSGMTLKHFWGYGGREALALTLALLEWNKHLRSHVTAEQLERFELARERLLREHTSIDPLVVRAQIAGIDGVMQDLRETLSKLEIEDVDE